MYVTYSDLIQIGIFLVSLVGLCYALFRANQPSVCTGLPLKTYQNNERSIINS